MTTVTITPAGATRRHVRLAPNFARPPFVANPAWPVSLTCRSPSATACHPPLRARIASRVSTIWAVSRESSMDGFVTCQWRAAPSATITRESQFRIARCADKAQEGTNASIDFVLMHGKLHSVACGRSLARRRANDDLTGSSDPQVRKYQPCRFDCPRCGSCVAGDGHYPFLALL